MCQAFYSCWIYKDEWDIVPAFEFSLGWTRDTKTNHFNWWLVVRWRWGWSSVGSHVEGVWGERDERKFVMSFRGQVGWSTWFRDRVLSQSGFSISGNLLPAKFPGGFGFKWCLIPRLKPCLPWPSFNCAFVKAKWVLWFQTLSSSHIIPHGEE